MLNLGNFGEVELASQSILFNLDTLIYTMVCQMLELIVRLRAVFREHNQS